jgi:TRAP-type C4-dicarboxylate transport system substrate-binding protein
MFVIFHYLKEVVMFKTISKWKALAFILALVCVVTFTFTSCGGGGGDGGESESGGDVITLKLASDAPQEHIATGLNEDLAKMVEEQTEGRVKVQYYPASQLGSYESVYKEVMTGSIDMAQITLPDATEIKLGAAYLPYYATNYEEAKILFGPDSYMAEQMIELNAKNGVKWVGFCLEGFIGMGTVKEPAQVMVPGANKKIKMRSPGMATFLYVQEDLGYQPTTITYAEVPTAIQTGVVDGWIGGTPNMNYAWVGDVIKQMYVNYIHAEATSYVISEKSLEKMTEEDQKIVLECIEQQSTKSFDEAQANEEDYKTKLAEDKGVEVIELSADELKTQADFVRDKTWTRLEKDLGKEFIAGFREEVKQFE